MVPGPRTYPTVKPLATMNNKNLKGWEMRFGVVQSVFLVGLIMGSIACAFLFGYYSGQRTGYENAMASNEAAIARVPIHVPSASAEVDSGELYAQLKERSGAGLAKTQARAHDGSGALKKDADIPELGNVKTLEESPLERAEDNGAEGIGDSDVAEPNQVAAANSNSVNNAIDSLLAAPQPEKIEKAPDVNLALGTQSKAVTDNDLTLGKLAATHPGEVLKVEPEKAKELVEASKVITKIEDVKKIKDTSVQSAGAKDLEEKKLAKVIANESKNAKLKEEAKTTSVSQILHGWFAQVAAPKKRGDADELSRKLKGSGFKVSIETASVRGEEYYRVLVGPEDSRDHAMRLVSQLKRESFLQGEPFVRMVK